MDYSSVFERAKQIEDTIERLQQERGLLLQQCNQLKASTRVFPDEILSTIFQLAYPAIPMEDRKFGTPFDLVPECDSHYQSSRAIQNLSRVKLGAVSSQWRRVAWSTPYLWTSLTLEVKNQNVAECAAIVKLFIENVGGLPFSLELDFSRRQKFDIPTYEIKSRESLESIQDLLFSDCPEKLHDLRLIAPPLEWLQFLSTQLITLKALSLTWPNIRGRDIPEPVKPLALENIPHLQRFCIHSSLILSRVTFKLNWEVITDLTLHNIHYDICLLLLCLCKNLRSFRSRRPLKSDPLVGKRLHIPFICPHLEQFEWVFVRNLRDNTNVHDTIWMLKHLELPSLRSLILHNTHDLLLYANIGDPLGIFFSRLPTTLVSLRLHRPPLQNSFLTHLGSHLRSIPSLKYLRMDQIYTCGVNTMSNLLYPPSNPDILPNLRSLKLTQCSNYPHRLPGCTDCRLNFDLITYTFNERNSSRLNPRFSVMVDGHYCNPEPVGLESHLQGLKVLAEHGHEVEIPDERPFNWSIKLS